MEYALKMTTFEQNKGMRLDLTFLRHWLLHSFLIGLVITKSRLISYLLNSYKTGEYYIKYPDGTPVTGWDYFVDVCLHFEWQHVLSYFVLGFVVEFNYKWITLNIKKSVFAKTLACACIFVAYSAVQYIIFSSTEPFLAISAIILFLYIIYFTVYASIRYRLEKRKSEAIYLHRQSQAELNTLKAQLNPHFFFNTLNNLYGTAIQENALKTVDMIEQLSSLMRYVMTEAQQNFVDITNELAFIENYWSLQVVKLPNQQNINLSKHIYFDEKQTVITPMLLIPFLENSFKYGISIDENCHVDLDLKIESQQLQMNLSNSIKKNHDLEKGNGIGVDNVKKRLDLIYKNAYSLVENAENDVYTIKLTIDLTKNTEGV